MDVFFEQIIKKKKTASELAAVAAIYAAGLLIGCVIVFSVIKFMPAFFLMGVMIAGLVFFGAIKLAANFNVEYEYSVTLGSFDIAKIVNKSNRTRLISADISAFDDFGIYDEKKFADKQFDERIVAVADGKSGLYYACLRHPKKGRVLVVFQPKARILAEAANYLPYQLKVKFKKESV